MNWLTHHKNSEKLACNAYSALLKGDYLESERLYLSAAKSEKSAFEALEKNNPRTRGITAMSVVALFLKGRNSDAAYGFALHCLKNEDLPEFARQQLQEITQCINTTNG